MMIGAFVKNVIHNLFSETKSWFAKQPAMLRKTEYIIDMHKQMFHLAK